jgi:hypothetical protein
VIAGSVQNGEIAIDWRGLGLQPNDLLNVALVQDRAEDQVGSGENSGRVLRHTNVVRDFHIVNPVKEKGSLTLKIPADVRIENLHVVAYVQSPTDASIHAATTLKIE